MFESMKIQTEQGRTVISAREELDLGVAEVKMELENSKRRLEAAPGELPVI